MPGWTGGGADSGAAEGPASDAEQAETRGAGEAPTTGSDESEPPAGTSE